MATKEQLLGFRIELPNGDETTLAPTIASLLFSVQTLEEEEGNPMSIGRVLEEAVERGAEARKRSIDFARTRRRKDAFCEAVAANALAIAKDPTFIHKLMQKHGVGAEVLEELAAKATEDPDT